MIVTVTATLVHLGTLTTTTLWTRWKGEEQVSDETKMPEVSFERRGGRSRHALGPMLRGTRSFRTRRKYVKRGSSFDLHDPHEEKEEGGQYGSVVGTSVGPGSRRSDSDYTAIINEKSRNIVARRVTERSSHGTGSNKVNVLILMSDTGGGHRASAQALEAAFEILYPGLVSVKMVDVLTEHTAWPMNASVEAYQFAAKNPVVWRAMYEAARFPPTRWATHQLITMQNFNSVREAMRGYDPDLVISVHPLCQNLPLKVLRALGADGRRRELPFVTVITDLGGAHPTWFDRTADKVFLASDAVMRIAFKFGVDARRIHYLGLPTRPAFWTDARPKQALRRELGLELGAPAAVIGRLGAVAANGRRMQVVVICGKNEAVREQLEGITPNPNLNVKVLGFVGNMDEWMGAVDVIITKAGPGTIAEATIRGLPIMLSGYLPGQEEGNVPFVVDGKFGAFSKNPRVIGDTVARWLSDPELLARMSAAAKRAAKPTATFDIAREIGDMMFEQPTGAEPGEKLGKRSSIV
ncbi:Monogalactosyldiacylglycerol synthase, family GT28 [Tribonema minus]|uniref:monogalactosyldiacylglycerol synthase n=1 Tax=Tribonema minus TaxID=303371 RepID=A0A835ZBT4_9STRA|nr:Monogalactosyldiacylglycerol synthase, family GT28 [Tribonema minus]